MGKCKKNDCCDDSRIVGDTSCSSCCSSSSSSSSCSSSSSRSCCSSSSSSSCCSSSSSSSCCSSSSSSSCCSSSSSSSCCERKEKRCYDKAIVPAEAAKIPSGVFVIDVSTSREDLLKYITLPTFIAYYAKENPDLCKQEDRVRVVKDAYSTFKQSGTPAEIIYVISRTTHVVLRLSTGVVSIDQKRTKSEVVEIVTKLSDMVVAAPAGDKFRVVGVRTADVCRDKRCDKKCKKGVSYALYKYYGNLKSGCDLYVKQSYGLKVFCQFIMFKKYEEIYGPVYSKKACRCYKKWLKCQEYCCTKQSYKQWKKECSTKVEYCQWCRFNKCRKVLVNKVLYMTRVKPIIGGETFCRDNLYKYLKEYMNFSTWRRFEVYKLWRDYATENGLDINSCKEYRTWRKNVYDRKTKLTKKHWRCWKIRESQDDYDALNAFFLWMKQLNEC